MLINILRQRNFFPSSLTTFSVYRVSLVKKHVRFKSRNNYSTMTDGSNRGVGSGVISPDAMQSTEVKCISGGFRGSLCSDETPSKYGSCKHSDCVDIILAT